MSKGIQNRYTTSKDKSITSAKIGEIIVCNDPTNPKLSFLDANNKRIDINASENYLPLDGGVLNGDLELAGTNLDVLNGNLNLFQESYINVEGTSSIDLTNGGTITLDETSNISIKLDSNSDSKTINKNLVTASGTSDQVVCGDGTLKNISDIGSGETNFLPLSGGTVNGFTNFNSGLDCYGTTRFILNSTKDNGVAMDGYGIHPISSGTYNLGTSDYKFYDAYIQTINAQRINGETINASNGFFQTSDKRLKTNIEPINVDLEKISQLRKIYFAFKNDKEKQKQIGLIAQEVKEIYPELVSENEQGFLSVDYSKLSVVALDAIDKLFNMNKNLDERLSKIEKLLEK